MSWVTDTTELIPGSWVTSAYPGLGIAGADIPSGGSSGSSIFFNDAVLPADSAVEFRAVITTPPSSGNLDIGEDGSFTFSGAADGNYSFVYRLYADGADLGQATVTLTVGSVSSGISVFNGAAFVSSTLKVFSGGNWIVPTVRVWNGAQWVVVQ